MRAEMYKYQAIDSLIKTQGTFIKYANFDMSILKRYAQTLYRKKTIK